jgi:hypothetical protein
LEQQANRLKPFVDRGFKKKHFPLLYLLSKAAPNRSATIFYGDTTNRRLLWSVLGKLIPRRHSALQSNRLFIEKTTNDVALRLGAALTL